MKQIRFKDNTTHKLLKKICLEEDTNLCKLVTEVMTEYATNYFCGKEQQKEKEKAV